MFRCRLCRPQLENTLKQCQVGLTAYERCRFSLEGCIPTSWGQAATPLNAYLSPPAAPLCTRVQVRISHEFSFVGKSVALILARLGLPAEALVKIRRTPPARVTTTPRGPLEEPVRYHGGVSGDEELTTSAMYTSPGSGSKALSAAGGSAGLTSQGESSVAESPRVRRRLSATAADAAAHSVPAAGGASPLPSSSSSSSSTVTLSPLQHQDATRTSSSPRLPSGHDPLSMSQTHGDANSEPDARSWDTGRLDDAVCPVFPAEAVRPGDILVLRCPRSTMISFLGSVLSEGLRGVDVLGTSAAQRQRTSATKTATAVFLELVLSDCNHFVGRRPTGHEAAMLASRYGCRIVAVRHTPTAAAAADSNRSCWKEEDEEEQKGSPASTAHAPHRCGVSSPLCPREERVDSPLRGGKKKRTAGLSAVAQDGGDGRTGVAAVTTPTEGSVGAADRPLAPGDVVLVVAEAGFLELWKDAPEFDLATRVGTVPTPVVVYDYVSLLVFCAMLGWVLLTSVTMVSGIKRVR